jgi:hypothetical protein
MRIIEYIKSLFIEKRPSKTSKFDSENSITFAMDGFGRPWISFHIEHADTKACENFATLLNNINTGQYQSQILDMIASLAQDRPDLSMSLQLVLVNWGLIISGQSDNQEQTKKTTSGYENKPFIRPRNAFVGDKR